MDIQQLFEAHHDEIYRYLWRSSHDDGLAQDLTQETFLKALRGLPNLPEGSNYRAWLYRIATNTQHDHWRKQGRRPVVEIDWSQHPDPATVESAYEERELLAMVAEAVAQLPEKQQQALILYRYQGLSYAEIGQILDISESAARADGYQAMKKLREWLVEEVQ